MKFNLKSVSLNKAKTDCLIIGVYEKEIFTESAKKLNKISHDYLLKLLKMGEFQGKIGQTYLAFNIPETTFSSILLVGCGKHEALTLKNYRSIISASMKALRSMKAKEVITTLTELDVTSLDLSFKIKHLIESMEAAAYSFEQFKTKKTAPLTLKNIIIYTEQKPSATSLKAITAAVAISEGVIFTKNLANLPSNICTPTYLADEAKKLGKSHRTIRVNILNKKDMKKLGMNALLAVSQGSAQEPKLISMYYQGAPKKEAPIALVGKGITFDTGGISLKPADSMVGMKYDMCGAATVFGTIKAAALLQLPINLVGIIASAENMPGGHAIKPEDIVTSLSGKTIEILNTDAEGRLVLADALTYTERFNPKTVIDIATLTGAVVIALGHHASGILSNHEPLLQALIKAGLEAHDRVWPLPLWEEYQDQLKSPFADMSNVGGRSAGTITAACFLSRFAEKFHWAHLDVAGTAAMMGGLERYATGRPVPLLMQYLINQCSKNKNAKN